VPNINGISTAVTLAQGNNVTIMNNTATGTITIASTGGGGLTPAFSTPSAANQTAAIGTTQMVGSALHQYLFSWAVVVNAPGSGCTGASQVVLNVTFQGPSAASSSAQISVPVNISDSTSSFLGSAGSQFSGVETVVTQPGTVVSYATAYTPGTGCGSTPPQYQVFPTLVALY
jgi:hypothetical protein